MEDQVCQRSTPSPSATKSAKDQPPSYTAEKSQPSSSTSLETNPTEELQGSALSPSALNSPQKQPSDPSTQEQPAHSEVVENPFASFNLFPDLPLELRGKIWRFAAAAPRVIHLTSPKRKKGTKYLPRISKRLSVSGEYDFYTAAIPGVLSTNFESRSEAFKTFKICLRHANGGKRIIYFNPDVDSITWTIKRCPANWYEKMWEVAAGSFLNDDLLNQQPADAPCASSLAENPMVCFRASHRIEGPFAQKKIIYLYVRPGENTVSSTYRSLCSASDVDGHSYGCFSWNLQWGALVEELGFQIQTSPHSNEAPLSSPQPPRSKKRILELSNTNQHE